MGSQLGSSFTKAGNECVQALVASSRSAVCRTVTGIQSFTAAAAAAAAAAAVNAVVAYKGLWIPAQRVNPNQLVHAKRRLLQRGRRLPSEAQGTGIDKQADKHQP